MKHSSTTAGTIRTTSNLDFQELRDLVELVHQTPPGPGPSRLLPGGVVCRTVSPRPAQRDALSAA